jgi:NAD(P)-dependent dehydrogenase (short-subunit alcohol dehydrogenase family)
VIAPGYALTPLIRETMSKDKIIETKKMKMPIHRYAEIKEISGSIAFLHSDAASYVVGANLVADRGYTII